MWACKFLRSLSSQCFAFFRVHVPYNGMRGNVDNLGWTFWPCWNAPSKLLLADLTYGASWIIEMILYSNVLQTIWIRSAVTQPLLLSLSICYMTWRKSTNYVSCLCPAMNLVRKWNCSIFHSLLHKWVTTYNLCILSTYTTTQSFFI